MMLDRNDVIVLPDRSFVVEQRRVEQKKMKYWLREIQTEKVIVITCAELWKMTAGIEK